MSDGQLALALSTSAPTAPPFRPGPSDPEMWAAVLHQDGRDRLGALLEERHGTDAAAKLADLDAFQPPHIYAAPKGAGHWAGWMNLLEHRLTEEVGRT